ncbi:MAG: hypothetical protein KAQ78_02795, partial [Candidatus Latescibacteria bacterium]|nr:hypothetical protein [Candidatus Latescibacterota bacterium]
MNKKGIFAMVALAIIILGGLSGCSDTTVNIYDTNIHESAQDSTSCPMSANLGYYYPILSKSPSHWSSLPVDQDGIVLIDYGGQIGKQYNPVTISQYALSNYNAYLETGEDSYKDELIKQADWLLEHQVITEKGFSVWYYNFDWDPKRYDCKAPWISSMS